MAQSIDVNKMLQESKAVASGHFVYKALYKHGAGYIDKDMFPYIGAQNLVALLEAEAEKALDMGLELSKYKNAVLVTPAYGAIKYGLPLAACLEKRTGTKIIVVETEVEKDETGKRYHIIPENQKKKIVDLPLFCKEDIVNNGTTIREVSELYQKELGMSLFAALSTVDRGGQTAETLGVSQYYPFLRLDMDQHDVRIGPCPQCAAGIPINTDLGKGEGWVKMFGQPPYLPDMDFSAFWNAK
ncbi:MAG: phosphoribosyltransferase [Patescibacteria group bacterium]|jgi:orotate phosphoribosyltransferase